MFKPTPQLQRALRRLPLTTKGASKDYYKGNRVGALGRHTKYGGYRIDWTRVRTYVVPDLTAFRLTPFVSREVEAPRTRAAKYEDPLDGQRFLTQWKDHVMSGGASMSTYN